MHLKIRRYAITIPYFALLLACALMLGFKRSDCYDVFGHMAAGREILNFGFLNYDIFTFTFSGKPWANVPWLFQIPLYLLYQWQGYKGIIILKGILSVLILFFLYLASRLRIDGNDRKVWPLFIPLLLFGLLIAHLRYTARPHMVSMLFTAIYLFIMYLYVEKDYKKGLYFLPFLQILWTNVHGSFLSGLFIIGVFFLEEIVRLIFDREHQSLREKLILLRRGSKAFTLFVLILILIPVSLISPEPELSLRMINEFSEEKYISLTRIMEWIPMQLSIGPEDFGPLFFLKSESLILVFSFLWLFAAINRFSHLKISDGIFFVFSITNVIAHRRFIDEFALLLTPSLIYYWYLIYERCSRGRKIAIGAFMISIWLVFFICTYLRFLASDDIGFSMKKSRFAAGTVQFIKMNNISGNIFNSYGQGYFLSFTCYPQVKVFIDGRPVGLYNPAFFFIYSIGTSGNRFDLIERLYPIDMILIDRNSGLFKELIKSRNWKLVYLEPVGGFFLRKHTPYKNLLDFKVNWIEGEVFSTDEKELQELQSFLSTLLEYDKENGFLLYIYAQALWNQGREAEALDMLKKAVKADPEFEDILLKEAEYLMKLTRHREALKALKRAWWLAPEDHKVLLRLSQCYAHLENYKKAYGLMERYIQFYRDIPDIEAYTHMGMLCIKAKSDSNKAIEYLTIAFYLAGKKDQEETAIFNLAVAYRFCSDFEKERALYTKILKFKPYSAEAWYKLGETYEAEGREEKAKEAFEKVLLCNEEQWSSKAEDKIRGLDTR